LDAGHGLGHKLNSFRLNIHSFRFVVQRCVASDAGSQVDKRKVCNYGGNEGLVIEKVQNPVSNRDEAMLRHLQTRRSVSAAAMTAPGPDRETLAAMLTIAARVPDHKKLSPWRFIVLEGPARAAFGDKLAAICAANEPDASAVRLETERTRFLRAPVVVVVVSAPKAHPACPEWEQVLSAGAACVNLLHASAAMGFGAQWITEWYGYDDKVKAAFGLAPQERFAGFVYIGTPVEKPSERERPDLDAITTFPAAPVG
jgi:nitroreductase